MLFDTQAYLVYCPCLTLDLIVFESGKAKVAQTSARRRGASASGAPSAAATSTRIRPCAHRRPPTWHVCARLLEWTPTHQHPCETEFRLSAGSLSGPQLRHGITDSAQASLACSRTRRPGRGRDMPAEWRPDQCPGTERERVQRAHI